MSKKKNAGSNLPTDFTPTTGWNYGLDGFDFDTDYGEGVLDRARLPEAKGLAQLPDGIVVDPKVAETDDVPVGVYRSEHEGVGDLSELMKEGSLAGLGWLNGEQDPARLPKNPVNRGIAELEQAWGVDRRTNGIVPNVDKSIADYEAALSEEAPKKKASEDLLNHIVFRAHRRSAFGDPIEEILKEAAETAGDSLDLVKEDLLQIQADHGLAGKVFIYAAAFPGLHNGKWKQAIRRKCSSARYVIAEQGSPVGDVVKMEVVDEVPWRKAHQFYAPRLQSAGFKVASEGHPRDVLRVAFLSIPQDLSPKKAQRVKPVEQRLVDTITREEARRAFEEAPPLVQEVVDNTEIQQGRNRKKAHYQVMRWLKAGLLKDTEARRLISSVADPRDVLRIGASLIQRTASAQYAGTGVGALDVPDLTEDQAWETLKKAEQKVGKASAKVEIQRKKQAAAKIQKWVEAGLLPEQAAKVLLASDYTAKELLKKAGEVVAEGRDLVKIRSKKAKNYAGPQYETAPLKAATYKGFTGEDARIVQAAENSGFRAGEIKGMLRWARQQMSEGMAGKDLTQLLQIRFTKGLRKAAQHLLEDVRKEHEAVSGHLYVDASAYATPKGTEGCEEGAKRHRTNDLRFVMAMSQCGSCVCNSNGSCTKYAKQLMEPLSVEERTNFQRDMMRQVEATDAEVTASLFAPTHDPQEYSLVAESNNLSLSEEAPEFEDVGNVFFGGIEIE